MAIIVQHMEDKPSNHDKSDPCSYISIALPENSLAICIGAILMAERSTASSLTARCLSPLNGF